MSDRAPALVVLNPHAQHGRARFIWPLTEQLVRSHGRARIVGLGQLESEVPRALNDGLRYFVAAGGDGTVHRVINALVDAQAPLHECTLGAVGLGSSNDFHKPAASVLRGIPYRLDVNTALRRDVGMASITDGGGRNIRRAFLISASLGATANANALFNRTDPLLRVLKPRSTSASICWAALKSLAEHRNLPATIELGNESHSTSISNLSILKTPHLAGTLRYDTPVEPASGLFAVNLCENMTRFQLANLLRRLFKGTFLGMPRTRHWSVPRLSVRLAAVSALELDGELYEARDVSFDLLPGAIRVCG